MEWRLPDPLLQGTYSTYGDKKIRKILGTPPFEPDIFLGREHDLTAVHEKLFAGNTLLLLVNGEGGIGKTTLASVYYRRYQHEYEHLAWVFAGESVQEALLTLAIPLQLNFPDTMLNEQRLGLLLEAMSELNKPCLLIIDNANRLEGLQRNYLALRSCPNFHILLTTRITEFEQAATYRIAPLERQTALDLFKKHYPNHRPEEDTLLAEILAAVGYNTLVIELLAKNLRNFNRLRTRYHLSSLLEDLQGKNLLALTHSGQVRTAYQAAAGGLRAEKPEDIITAMYDLSELKAAESKLLSVFAVLPAENIAFDILNSLMPDTEALDGTLLALAQTGWIDYDEHNNSFKVSPVVQEITQRKHTDLLENCRPLISGLLDKLVYEPGTGHFINASYEEAAGYAHYAAQVVISFKEADHKLAVLCERIGNYHKTTGNLDQAMTFFERYAEMEQELYEAFPQNVSFKNGLAVSYWKLGDYHRKVSAQEEARGYFLQAEKLLSELVSAFPAYAEFQRSLGIVQKDLENL